MISRRARLEKRKAMISTAFISSCSVCPVYRVLCILCLLFFDGMGSEVWMDGGKSGSEGFEESKIEKFGEFGCLVRD